MQSTEVYNARLDMIKALEYFLIDTPGIIDRQRAPSTVVKDTALGGLGGGWMESAGNLAWEAVCSTFKHVPFPLLPNKCSTRPVT